MPCKEEVDDSQLPTQTVCVRKDCVDKKHHPAYICPQTPPYSKPDGTLYHGFSLKVEIPSKAAFLECITPEMFSKGRLLANKCLKMYMVIGIHSLATSGTQELHNNPPFPAWRSASRRGDACSVGLKKDGLNEVWN